MFGMPDITTSIMSPAPGNSADHGVGLGEPHPLTFLIIGSGHIPPYTPFVRVFSLPSPGLKTSVHFHRGGSGYVNARSTPYIPSYVPSSITLFTLNVVVIMNPSYIL